MILVNWWWADLTINKIIDINIDDSLKEIKKIKYKIQYKIKTKKVNALYLFLDISLELEKYRLYLISRILQSFSCEYNPNFSLNLF